MRLFVAIELPDALKAAAADAIDRLRSTLPDARHCLDARWVHASHLHITLAFIGSRPDADLPSITAALGRRLDAAPFELELGGFGAFPPRGQPRVLWLGVPRGSAPAAALQREVSGRLQPAGYQPEDRAFSPHVTVARVKDARGPAADVRRLIQQCPAAIGTFTVERVTLFQSHLSPGGSTYEPLLRVPLQG